MAANPPTPMTIAIDGYLLAPDQLLVEHLTYEDALGRMFEMHLDLLSPDAELDIDRIVGARANIGIAVPGQPVRVIDGYVSQFAQAGHEGGMHGYRATVVPWLWFLTLTSDCRIFQNKTVPDIVKEVLGEEALQKFEDKTSTLYQPVEYCVQHRETDFQFVSRLMEREGIYYYFTHTSTDHTMVLTDSGADPAQNKGDFPHRDGPDAGLDQHLWSWTHHRRVRPGKTTLNSYDFTAPRNNLKASGDALPTEMLSGREMFEQSERHLDVGEGSRQAKMRTEEWHVRQTLATAMTNTATLCTGDIFKLTDHHRTKLEDKTYRVVATRFEHFSGDIGGAASVESERTRFARLRPSLLDSAFVASRSHRSNEPLEPALAWPKEGDASLPAAPPAVTPPVAPTGTDSTTPGPVHPEHPNWRIGPPGPPGPPGAPGPAPPVARRDKPFECELLVIPESIKFRPERGTPRPIISGPQTATVVGAAGDVGPTDLYGRVKVQFHWDRYGSADANSSCWVRVSQNWAGNRYGTMFLPHGGQEVIVEFLEGDPDRPIIAGRVYNQHNMPPLELPSNKDRTVVARDHFGNEIIFNPPGPTTGGVDPPPVLPRTSAPGITQHSSGDSTKQSDNDDWEFILGSKGEAVVGLKTEAVGGVKAELTVGTGIEFKVGGSVNVSLGARWAATVGHTTDVSIGTSYAYKQGIHVEDGSDDIISTSQLRHMTIGQVETRLMSYVPAGAAVRASMVKLTPMDVSLGVGQTVGGAPDLGNLGGLAIVAQAAMMAAGLTAGTSAALAAAAYRPPSNLKDQSWVGTATPLFYAGAGVSALVAVASLVTGTLASAALVRKKRMQPPLGVTVPPGPGAARIQLDAQGIRLAAGLSEISVTPTGVTLKFGPTHWLEVGEQGVRASTGVVSMEVLTAAINMGGPIPPPPPLPPLTP